MPTFNFPPDELTRLARAEGFDLAGVAALDDTEEQGCEDPGKYLEDWIAAGHAGEMEYLKRRNDQGVLLRSEVQAAIPWARAFWPRSSRSSPREMPPGCSWSSP